MMDDGFQVLRTNGRRVGHLQKEVKREVEAEVNWLEFDVSDRVGSGEEGVGGYDQGRRGRNSAVSTSAVDDSNGSPSGRINSDRRRRRRRRRQPFRPQRYSFIRLVFPSPPPLSTITIDPNLSISNVFDILTLSTRRFLKTLSDCWGGGGFFKSLLWKPVELVWWKRTKSLKSLKGSVGQWWTDDGNFLFVWFWNRTRRTQRTQQLRQPEQHPFDQQLCGRQPVDAARSDAVVEQHAATVCPFVVSGSG